MFNIKNKLLTAVSVFFVATISSSYAEDCERQSFNNVQPGQVHNAVWKFKRNKVCEMVWRPGLGTFYDDIELLNIPKSCNFKSNRYAIAASCSKSGKYKFVYKLYVLERNGNKGPITFNVDLTVVD
jgi:hypothetical protein